MSVQVEVTWKCDRCPVTAKQSFESSAYYDPVMVPPEGWVAKGEDLCPSCQEPKTSG